MTDTIDANTATAIASTRALAQRYDELATSSLVLGDLAGDITMSPASAKCLAKLLRDHADMLRDVTIMHAIAKANADRNEGQLLRAMALLSRIETFSIFEFMAYRRNARKSG